MGCRILTNTKDDLKCFYCSTTDIAFGPIMPNYDWADKFFDWLPNDPRKYPVDMLIGLWATFHEEHQECAECGTVTDQHTCPECVATS